MTDQHRLRTSPSIHARDGTEYWSDMNPASKRPPSPDQASVDSVQSHRHQRRRSQSFASHNETPPALALAKEPDVPRLVRTLSIEPLHRFQKQCATYQQPKEIATFSYDEERARTSGDAQLSYYVPPNVEEIDLNVGYDTYIPKDQSIREHLDALLASLSEIRAEAAVGTDTPSDPPHPSVADSDFLCYRGTMTKILTTPYARREGWELRATRFKNAIYLEQYDSDEKLAEKDRESETQKRSSYWGFKFESYCTSPKPPNLTTAEDLRLRRTQVLNGKVEYASVFKTKLGRNSIIMGAEVDCIVEPKGKNPCSQYLELKTSKMIRTAGDRRSFERYKLIKFWAQSFLCGIPTVVVGFRTPEGRVQSLQNLKTLEIPRMVRGKDYWDPTVCLNFADHFLETVRKVLAASSKEDDDGGDPEVTWTIRYAHPFRHIEFIEEGRKNRFLTQSYIDSFAE